MLPQEDAREADLVAATVRSKLFGKPHAIHRIGRYALVRALGSGAHGTVYAAYDEMLDRRVAIKLLRPDPALDRDGGPARLLREARSLARVKHKHIVQVYDVGVHEGEVFVAMEYVRGASLREWARGKDWRAILGASLKAGDGLAAAHRAEIVHRDFKPDNVIVDETGEPFVLDFGLARTDDAATPEITSSFEEGLRADARDAEGPMTRPGIVLGSPAYMSAEQHRGEPTTAASDQFSFCATVFELLYGKPPFWGRNALELSVAIACQEITPRPEHTPVPRSVDAALRRGLASDPADRFDSMGQLLAALAHAHMHRHRGRARVAVLWTVAATVAIAAAVWLCLVAATP